MPEAKENMRKETWIAPAVFVEDQALKASAKKIPEEGLTLIPGVLGLRTTRNTGMAFSLFSGHPWLLGLLGLAMLGSAILFLRKKEIPRLPFIGLMLMAGGAAGNITDRLIHGYVTDMIELLFIRFAVFNLADAALTVGCGLTMLYLLWIGDQTSKGNSSK